MVEHLSYHPKSKGSSPTSAIGNGRANYTNEVCYSLVGNNSTVVEQLSYHPKVEGSSPFVEQKRKWPIFSNILTSSGNSLVKYFPHYSRSRVQVHSPPLVKGDNKGFSMSWPALVAQW